MGGLSRLLLVALSFASLASPEEQTETEDILRTIVDGQLNVLQKIEEQQATLQTMMEELYAKVADVDKSQKQVEEAVREQGKASEILAEEQGKLIETMLTEQELKMENWLSCL
ncbi:uncharacterized protein [Macrobrachium rosenbergii]|uniref:uncharacterized protein n=1 Tax=Macrobrachium rosenbergii TaxID=79674 RepID=UPI0034D3BFE5